MTSPWVEIVGRQIEEALDLMDAVVRDCPDELWQANMWELPEPSGELRDGDGNLVIDAADRHALVALAQWNGQPWGVAWHALEILEFNLTDYIGIGEYRGFGGKRHWPDTPLTAWSQTEMLGYIDYCRERLVYARKEFMEERAATADGHGRLYGDRVLGKMRHLVEHATQIRQFIDWTASGLIPHPQIHSPTEGRWAKR